MDLNFEEKKLYPIKMLSKRVKVGFVGSCSKYYCDSSKGIPMIRTTNLSENGVTLNNLKYVTEEFYENNVKSQLHFGDILIARHGENGLPSMWSYNFKAQCLNVVIIEPNNELVDKYFLYYMIKSPLVQHQIKSRVGGSVQGVINTKDISELLIPYYSKKNQNKIVLILKKIDKKINLNRKINQNLYLNFRYIYFSRHQFRD